MKKRAIVLSRRVESRILVLRGHRVILDADLAELYGVEVKRLNQQVKRNIDRFPGDFVLQLSSAEYESLRLQFATSNEGREAEGVTCPTPSPSTVQSWQPRC